MSKSDNVNNHSYLFGGSKDWDSGEWTSSDDRVRGGKSQSYLTILDEQTPPRAVFHGHLDTTALGGAGFASQRTVEIEKTWNLTGYDGLLIKVARSQSGGEISHQFEHTVEKSQKKCNKFTLIVKDTILPPDPDTGREQSTTSWEGDFEVEDTQQDTQDVTFAWNDLKPYYRGKELPNDKVKPLNIAEIKRFSIMMRSHFGEQQGEFELQIYWIAAVVIDKSGNNDISEHVHEKSTLTAVRTWRQRFKNLMCF